ncbi:MAG: tRNA preQ1(34) S-adenosylmethionine ribosyltransferase-isomerase QueA [Planctomycetes bacterium]|nr:tRNA preQ1(34) S-adenosylmethionine ribosyltransferase-isomerase QueA [Planctomycetota bacterium]
MHLSDFLFALPRELIAQSAVEPRDQARLMVLERASGAVTHRRFADLHDYLRAGDLLVLNDTRVIPARLFGRRATGRLIELLLVREAGGGAWESIVGGGKGLRIGETLEIEGGAGARATMAAKLAPGRWRVGFDAADARAILAAAGKAPLPPYIHRPKLDDPARESDRVRYQTVYAHHDGAIAAPTAGLHFTPELLGRLGSAGVEMRYVTLHVGPGTFRPMTAEHVEEHELEAERFRVGAETVAALARARSEGRRVVAVGTTCTRVLETLARRGELPAAPDQGKTWVREEGGGGLQGESALFIYPPFEFRTVGALVTNFHLPDGSPLVLAAAFAGREKLLAAYREAVAQRYRFFSYGDAMVVV